MIQRCCRTPGFVCHPTLGWQSGARFVRRNSSEKLRFANDSNISMPSSTTSAGHGVASDFTVRDAVFNSGQSR